MFRQTTELQDAFGHSAMVLQTMPCASVRVLGFAFHGRGGSAAPETALIRGRGLSPGVTAAVRASLKVIGRPLQTARRAVVPK